MKQSRSVAEEAAREQKFWKRNYLWTALLILAVVVYSLIKGPGLSVSPTATELNLTMHGGETLQIPYASITEAELLEEPDFGTLTEGKDARNGKSGIWEQPQWGSYTLCVYSSCRSAIRVVADGKVYLVNMATQADTDQLFGIIAERAAIG